MLPSHLYQTILCDVWSDSAVADLAWNGSFRTGNGDTRFTCRDVDFEEYADHLGSQFASEAAAIREFGQSVRPSTRFTFSLLTGELISTVLRDNQPSWTLAQLLDFSAAAVADTSAVEIGRARVNLELACHASSSASSVSV